MSEQRLLTSASNLHRREACPGSAFAEAGYPNEESDAAAEGTMLHALMADTSMDRTHLNGEQLKTIQAAEEMNLQLWKIVGEAMARRGQEDDFEPDQGHEVELWLRRGIKPIMNGHCDHWRYFSHQKLLVIVDYKFGRIAVDEAESNLQLRAYAVMGAEKWDCDHILVAINQPRLAYEKRLTISEYTREALKAAKAQLLDIYDKAHNKDGTPREDAPRVAGESQCRYCRAQLLCPTYRETYSFLADSAPMGKEAYVQDRIMTMGDADLDRVYTACKFAALISDKAKEEILRRQKLGGMLMWQSVPGRKNTEITDRARAVRLLQNIGLPLESVLECAKLSLPELSEELRRRDGLKQKEAKERIFQTLQPVLEITETAPSLKRVEGGQPELLP